MSWNYRIVKRLGVPPYPDYYSLHEVYYDEVGLPWAMTANPATFGGDVEDGPEGVQESLRRALNDATNRPILDEPEDGKWPGQRP